MLVNDKGMKDRGILREGRDRNRLRMAQTNGRKEHGMRTKRQALVLSEWCSVL